MSDTTPESVYRQMALDPVPIVEDVPGLSGDATLHAFEKCPKCDAYLGLSLTLIEGHIAEWRVNRPRAPRAPRAPSCLAVGKGGVYCEKCGTHVTEAEELAARSVT